jgi:hypothetical protein
MVADFLMEAINYLSFLLSAIVLYSVTSHRSFIIRVKLKIKVFTITADVIK